MQVRKKKKKEYRSYQPLHITALNRFFTTPLPIVTRSFLLTENNRCSLIAIITLLQTPKGRTDTTQKF